MSTTSKPNIPGIIALTSTGVDVLSPFPDDTDIVVAPTPLSFRLNLAITGIPGLAAGFANEPVEVSHHVEQVETGARFTLGPFALVTPASVGSFNFVTGPFTSSLNGGAGQFQTAAGDDDGVYRILTEFHFTANAGMKANSVFDDRILAITAP